MICMGDAIDTIIERETEKVRIETYIDLVRENSLKIEIAAAKTGITVEEFQKLVDKNPLKKSLATCEPLCMVGAET